MRNQPVTLSGKRKPGWSGETNTPTPSRVPSQTIRSPSDVISSVGRVERITFLRPRARLSWKNATWWKFFPPTFEMTKSYDGEDDQFFWGRNDLPPIESIQGPEPEKNSTEILFFAETKPKISWEFSVKNFVRIVVEPKSGPKATKKWLFLQVSDGFVESDPEWLETTFYFYLTNSRLPGSPWWSTATWKWW